MIADDSGVPMFKLLIAFVAGLVFAAPLSAASPSKCAPVSLALSGGPKPFTAKYSAKSPAFVQASANFAKAYAKACGEGLLKKKPLVDAKAKDKAHLILLNAPEANIASIYLNAGKMLLEYPFVTDFGKASVPSADDLHEAIYCAVHGASAKEQEESGRCLPD
jgi:hypothetical protein